VHRSKERFQQYRQADKTAGVVVRGVIGFGNNSAYGRDGFFY
jgi:hypothetical protein